MKKYTNIKENIIHKENRKKSRIYKLTNNVNGKCYIGSSMNLGNRFYVYFSKKKVMFTKLNNSISIIYIALLKYDYNNFSLKILEYYEKDILIEREQYYINELKPAYNILKFANSRLGSKHKINTKNLMSIK